MQTVKVQGMTCVHCEAAVTAAIHDVDPTATVSVDLAEGVVQTASTAPLARIVAAIEAAGYRATIDGN